MVLKIHFYLFFYLQYEIKKRRANDARRSVCYLHLPNATICILLSYQEFLYQKDK